MNVLENILEEIDKAEENYCHKKLSPMFLRGVCSMYADAKQVIRTHMDEVNNNGWIPVSKQLPEDGTYLCTFDGELLGIDEPFTGMCGIENGKWDEEGCVIAWRHLPEPYCPEE